MNDAIKNKLNVFTQTLEKFPEFRYLGDSILRQKAEEIGIDEGLEIGRRLGELLIKYRKMVGYGRGLAAPQIGIGKSVFVTYLDDKVQMYINPQIVSSSDNKNYYRELCLSSGIVWCDVCRPEAATLKWINENKKQRQEEFTGVLARLLQHEYDHLLGIVNLDKAKLGTIEFVTSDPLQEKLRDFEI